MLALYDVIPVAQKILSICEIGLQNHEKLLIENKLIDLGIKTTISIDELLRTYSRTYNGHSAIVKHMLSLKNLYATDVP